MKTEFNIGENVVYIGEMYSEYFMQSCKIVDKALLYKIRFEDGIIMEVLSKDIIEELI